MFSFTSPIKLPSPVSNPMLSVIVPTKLAKLFAIDNPPTAPSPAKTSPMETFSVIHENAFEIAFQIIPATLEIASPIAENTSLNPVIFPVTDSINDDTPSRTPLRNSPTAAKAPDSLTVSRSPTRKSPKDPVKPRKPSPACPATPRKDPRTSKIVENAIATISRTANKPLNVDLRLPIAVSLRVSVSVKFLKFSVNA